MHNSMIFALFHLFSKRLYTIGLVLGLPNRVINNVSCLLLVLPSVVGWSLYTSVTAFYFFLITQEVGVSIVKKVTPQVFFKNLNLLINKGQK